MKRLDTFRTIDLIIQAILSALLVILIILVKLTAGVLDQYAPEVANTPFFLAFLPLVISVALHCFLEYGNSTKGNESLVEMEGKRTKPLLYRIKNYLGIGGLAVTAILVLLGNFLNWGDSGDKVWVLFLFPAILPSFYMEVVLYVISILKIEGKRKYAYLSSGIALAILPLSGLLCFYLDAPAYLYCLLLALPLAYLLGDNHSVAKESSDVDGSLEL